MTKQYYRWHISQNIYKTQEHRWLHFTPLRVDQELGICFDQWNVDGSHFCAMCKCADWLKHCLPLHHHYSQALCHLPQPQTCTAKCPMHTFWAGAGWVEAPPVSVLVLRARSFPQSVKCHTELTLCSFFMILLFTTANMLPSVPKRVLVVTCLTEKTSVLSFIHTWVMLIQAMGQC